MTYLLFSDIVDTQVQIWNKKEEHLGRLEKIRVGQWLSWCLFLNQDCYLSASCQDEVRQKTKELNAIKGD
jgi:hypothetical protein